MRSLCFRPSTDTNHDPVSITNTDCEPTDQAQEPTHLAVTEDRVENSRIEAHKTDNMNAMEDDSIRSIAMVDENTKQRLTVDELSSSLFRQCLHEPLQFTQDPASRSCLSELSFPQPPQIRPILAPGQRIQEVRRGRVMRSAQGANNDHVIVTDAAGELGPAAPEPEFIIAPEPEVDLNAPPREYSPVRRIANRVYPSGRPADRYDPNSETCQEFQYFEQSYDARSLTMADVDGRRGDDRGYNKRPYNNNNNSRKRRYNDRGMNALYREVVLLEIKSLTHALQSKMIPTIARIDLKTADAMKSPHQAAG